MGAYAHHGLLTPGVKLFRRIGFPVKSAIILCVMLVPTLILAVALYQNNSSVAASTKDEQAGLRYVNSLNGLLYDVSAMRMAATLHQAELADKSTRVKEAWSKVQATHEAQDFQYDEDTLKNYHDLSTQMEDLLSGPSFDSPQAAFDTYTKTTSVILALLRHVGDDSQLALDPELDTYHMMNIVVNMGPQYEEYFAQLNVLGLLSLSDSSGLKLPAERHERVSRAITLMGYVDPIYENSYRSGVARYPEVIKNMDMDGVDSSREAFLSLYETAVMGDVVSANAAALAAAGEKAHALQVEINRQIAARLEAQLQARLDRLHQELIVVLGLALFCLVVALYFMAAFYRVTKGGLGLISKHLQELAEGDLRNRPVDPLGKDEPANLILDLHLVYDSMNELIRRVRHSARELATTSHEVSRASTDLSERTEMAASRLGEQANNMSQIGEHTRLASQNTKQAAVMAQGNAEAAQEGGKIISTVSSVMREMQASSSRIADIIGTIDGIAFQTNILALNAAVEAARAGESGRGFAVVASEVRSLASNTGKAAKEITELISTIVKQVSSGADAVEGASYNINELVANANQIKLYLEEISDSTEVQANRVNDVVATINELDSHTQQNAALVEETSGAAVSLNEQAERLTEEIANFRVA